MNWYLDGLLRPGFSSRHCQGCGIKLELRHPAAGLLLNSLCSAGILTFLMIKEAPYMLLWVLLLALLSWLIYPVWTWIFSSLVVWSYNEEQSSKLEKMNAHQMASTIAIAGWVIYMIFTVTIPYYNIIVQISELDEEAWTAMEDYSLTVKDRVFSPRGKIEFLIGILSLCWGGTNFTIKSRYKTKIVKNKLSEKNVSITNDPDLAVAEQE